MDSGTYYPILIICCIFLEGLFSGGELSLISSDINKIRSKAKCGESRAVYAMKLLDKPEWFLAATLTGTNLSVVTSASLMTAMLISRFGAEKGEIMSVLVMVPILILMISVRTLFQQHAEYMALRAARFIWAASWLFFPMVYLISRVSRGATAVVQGRKGAASPYITKDGLKFILEDKGVDSDILSSEREMVKRILDFSGITVGKIMIPLSAVMAMPLTATVGEAVALASERKHLHIPVYRDQPFNITGIVNYFELLEGMHGGSAGMPSFSEGDALDACLNRDVLYVPASKPAKELLIELQIREESMAVVVDEYGGAVGIVTIQDILEEVVGEMDAGYERGEQFYKRIGAGKYLINARISLERISQLLPLHIPEGDYETLGGFLLFKMGKIPKRRDTLRLGAFLFVVEDADMRTINEVFVEFPSALDKTCQT